MDVGVQEGGGGHEPPGLHHLGGRGPPRLRPEEDPVEDAEVPHLVRSPGGVHHPRAPEEEVPHPPAPHAPSSPAPAPPFARRKPACSASCRVPNQTRLGGRTRRRAAAPTGW